MRFRAFFRQIAILLSLLAAFSSIGGTWIFAQGIAWGRMAINYSQRQGVRLGLRETFDGKHPCRLCHELVQEHQREGRPNPSIPPLTFEVFVLTDPGEPQPRISSPLRYIAVRWRPWTYESPRPPLPPPQAFFV